MKIFRTEIHGHIVEARQGDLGWDRVLLDGKLVSSKPLGGWYNASHFLEIEDKEGKTRNVEVGWIDRSKLKIGRYRMTITVDGVERGEVMPIVPSRDPTPGRPAGLRQCDTSVRDSRIHQAERTVRVKRRLLVAFVATWTVVLGLMNVVLVSTVEIHGAGVCVGLWLLTAIAAIASLIWTISAERKDHVVAMVTFVILIMAAFGGIAVNVLVWFINVIASQGV